MNATELHALIEKVFSKVKMPERGSIVSMNDPESLDVENSLCGKPWQSISPELIYSNRVGIFFLTPQAYRYYLPAYMLASIRDLTATDNVADSIIYGFTFREKCKDFTYSRLRAFTSEELDVITEFIKFMKQEYPNEFFDDAIKGVLESIKSVQNEYASSK